jgi:tyrosyl-tRNA synthetase
MTKKMTLSEELKWRGFIAQTTLKDFDEIDTKKVVFYHGFDASAPSQTIGNLAGMMVDFCFLRHGHKGIILAGGATSLVGDPGGKDKERPLQTEETIAFNVDCAKKQIQKIFGKFEFTMVNNLDWTKDKNILFFLREVGKYFSVGEMIKKEYIANRLGEGAAGISFTEFSYELLQGFDYLHLFENYNCTLQLGGADQWTNCLAGTELIRRKLGKETHVLTFPLVIDKVTGKKFGKSEAGAVWLDPEKTRPYDFYQYWINTDDVGCKDYVKIYTSIEKDEFENLLQESSEKPSERIIQKYLAYNVTKLVHGQEEADKAKKTSEELFGGHKNNLENLETFVVEHEFINDNKVDLVNFLCTSGIIKSKREARDLLDAGGIYIDDVKVVEAMFPLANLKNEKEFLLRVGKKKYFKIKL